MSSVYKSQLHIVPRQTNRGLKGTFERCRFPRNEAKGSRSASFVGLYPSCAPLRTQSSLA